MAQACTHLDAIRNVTPSADGCEECLRICEVFVLPSPSAAARRYWKIEPWRDLADWLRATKPWRF